MRCFDYRETRAGAYTNVFVIVRGEIVEPAYREYSKTGRHGTVCYDDRVFEEADTVLYVDVSNSGKHYCAVDVRRWDDASVAKVLELHDCPKVREIINWYDISREW